jgi:HAD superfamily hydrolase (TIGR01509 family)
VNSGAVPLRPGVLALMAQAQDQGLQLAIATTTTPVNIDALLRRELGGQWRTHFSSIGDASTAPLKKPHPQVYLQMLDTLQCQGAQCLAFEDSFNGLQASRAAGLATVITPTRYTADHDFSGALRVLPDLGHADLPRLRAWHATHLHWYLH